MRISPVANQLGEVFTQAGHELALVGGGLREIFARAGLPVQVQAIGNRFCLNYGLEEEPRSYRDAMKYDRDLAARFAAVAQEEGVYFHTLWHSGLSAMHTLEDVDEALERIERAARRVAAERG